MDKALKPVPQKESADFFKVLERNEKNPDAGWERTYLVSGQIRSEKYFSSYEQEILEGKKKVWREDGSLWTESEYANNKLHGYWISYWEYGELKRKDLYQKGKLKEKNVWDESGNTVEWYPMEIRPEFPGGKKALRKYLNQNVKRPKGEEGGRVVVKFVIDVDGSITDVSIIESTNLGLNMAAYNVVANMPAWKPAKQDGNAVRVIRRLPLNFPN